VIPSLLTPLMWHVELASSRAGVLECAWRVIRQASQHVGEPSLWIDIVEFGDKLNDVDPLAYLTDVLTRIVNGHPNIQIDQLLPWAYPYTTGLKAAA